MFASIPSPAFNGLHLGPLEVRIYGLTYVVAVIAAIAITSRRWERKGGSRELVREVALWAFPAGLIGGRLYFLATSWNEAPDQWWGPLAVWRGGLGIWGGIALGTMAGLVVLRRRGADLPGFLDAAAPGLLVAQAIGRVGNYFNQELFGGPTNLPWGLEIDAAHRPARYAAYDTFHPTFLYELSWDLALAGALIWLGRHRQIRAPGLFALYVAGYSGFRIVEELFLRTDPAHHIFGLRLNFFVASLLCVTGLFWFARTQRAGSNERRRRGARLRDTVRRVSAFRRSQANDARSSSWTARSRAFRLFSIITLIIAFGTIAGLLILWPGHVTISTDLSVESYRARVERVEETICPGFMEQRCQSVTLRLQSGPDRGETVPLLLGALVGLDPDVDPGDEIRVTEAPEPPETGAPVMGTGYNFYDFERGKPMALLALLFVGIVLLFARLRGALSLVGLGLSLVIVLVFMVPAILDHKPPLAVAIVGSLAIALTTIPLAHGWGAKSLGALLGTAGSLLLTAGLAVLFTGLTHLTGFSSEEATILQLSGADLSLQGLLLAGIVIGALGVLDDVTISQSSTVLALRNANPGFGFRELFTRAQHVGRDHVSATVNTLLLAYAGASLPVLLIFSSADLGFTDVLNLELVAKEVVAMLVGSIGLISAVPVTTAFATMLALGEQPDHLDSAPIHAH